MDPRSGIPSSNLWQIDNFNVRKLIITHHGHTLSMTMIVKLFPQWTGILLTPGKFGINMVAFYYVVLAKMKLHFLEFSPNMVPG